MAPVNTYDLKKELTTLQRPMAIKSCGETAEPLSPHSVEESDFELEAHCFVRLKLGFLRPSDSTWTQPQEVYREGRSDLG